MSDTPHPTTVRRRARKAGIPPAPAGRKRKAASDTRSPLTIRLPPAWRAWVKAEAKRLSVTETSLIETALSAKYPELLAIVDS